MPRREETYPVNSHAGRHAEQQEFYAELYGVTEEPGAVLRALVRQKERFAQHALQMALQQALSM